MKPSESPAIKVGELEGAVLNYWVAGAVGLYVDPTFLLLRRAGARSEFVAVKSRPNYESWEPFNPSANWAHAGPIIEFQRIQLLDLDGVTWAARKLSRPSAETHGPTPLIAAMRFVVQAYFGIDVPDLGPSRIEFPHEPSEP